MAQVFIGLGSNLNNPVQQIETALRVLKQLPQTQWVQTSKFYRSQPHGVINQPEFINAVAELCTELKPLSLLRALQRIERRQQRVRTVRFGPRTLDLDILLYGDLVLKTSELTIPHYALHQREFVLYPLAEIAPHLTLPSGESVVQLVAGCSRNGLELIT